MSDPVHAASVTRTLRLKVRSESYAWLSAAAIEVNQVWNFCNEEAASVLGNLGKWLSGFDLCYRTAGSSQYDLGLKAVATTSDGGRLDAARFYRDVEQKIAQAQRRGHKRQAKRLHRKAARRRADALHKFSRKMVNQYQNIVVGDVSTLNLVRTRMAKSVLDSGWGMLRAQLAYKGQQAGRSVEVVSEPYTSQACSACGSLSGPRGQDMLVVRAWECRDCGASHDRDVNAARNILARAKVNWRPSAGTGLSDLPVPSSRPRVRGREAGTEAARTAA